MRTILFLLLSFLLAGCFQQGSNKNNATHTQDYENKAQVISDELPIRDSIPSQLTSDEFWKGKLHCDRFVNLYDTTQVLEEETEVNFYYDETGFLFTIYLEEENVRYRHTQRDSKIWEDPCFEVFFDPGADGLNYYEFQINAYPQVWDLKLKSDLPPINAPENILPWDIGDNYGVTLKRFTPNDDSDVDHNWGITGTLNWDAFSEGRPRGGDRWAYNFMRVDYDKAGQATYWVAKSTGEENIHHPSTWPIYTF